MKYFHLALVTCSLSTASLAGAPDEASWSLNVSTSGEDIYWTSPDDVRTDGEIYHSAYQVLSVSVNVSYAGFEFGPFDVTDQIDLDDLLQEADAEGPCPVDFGSTYVHEPPPPAPVTIAFEVGVELNAAGHGIYRMEDIILGTATYDLGWPFGEVTVQIEEVFLSGLFEVEVIGTHCAADLDGNGSVGVDDLLAVIADWGCAGCESDINGDGLVGVDDLLEVISSWGICS